LDMKRFAADKKKATKVVKLDMKEADAAGLEGTPTFYVNGLRCEFEELQECIDNARKGK